MRTFFITLLLVIVSLSPVFSQPKYEIRATWITTLGGMDWPRNKAVNASGIRRQQRELCDTGSPESRQFQYGIVANPSARRYDLSFRHRNFRRITDR